MRKKSYKPYIFLTLFLSVFFYFPKGFVDSLRGVSISLFKGGETREIGENLDGEILLFKKQNKDLRRRLFSEEVIDHQIKKLGAFDKEGISEFYERRKKAALDLLNLELSSINGEVIYRDSTHWNATLWVNVGSKDNERYGKEVIGVGSPVLSRDHLIGVVEKVGKRKSLVRLLTDSSLPVSVRVLRGKEGNEELLHRLELLIKELNLRDETQETFIVLGQLKDRLEKECPSHYLAKGELYGSSGPLWRGRSETLKGVGFNYDFGDLEGGPLELQTGKPLDQLSLKEGIPLIEVGDLLVTTGMDGVFPKDIPVAHVSKISPLKEGSVSYEIEAFLCAGNLDHLFCITVLPPYNIEEEF